MTLQRIGRSEAGKRIWEAGIAYQARRCIPDPEPPKIEPIDFYDEEPEPVSPVPKQTLIGETFQSIVERVSELTGVSVEDILSDKRDRKTTAARQAAYYGCIVHTNRSYKVVGKFFGRDHSTVMFGVIAAAERYGLPMPARKGKHY